MWIKIWDACGQNQKYQITKDQTNLIWFQAILGWNCLIAGFCWILSLCAPIRRNGLKWSWTLSGSRLVKLMLNLIWNFESHRYAYKLDCTNAQKITWQLFITCYNCQEMTRLFLTHNVDKGKQYAFAMNLIRRLKFGKTHSGFNLLVNSFQPVSNKNILLLQKLFVCKLGYFIVYFLLTDSAGIQLRLKAWKQLYPIAVALWIPILLCFHSVGETIV